MEGLKDRVVVITGGGRGLGREHALLLASEGAKVVINDLGGQSDGTGTDPTAAQAVVEEIAKLGGQAIANTDSVSDWDGARRLVQTAVEHFGDLHVLINNAGILRDRMLVHMEESEWDDVLAVHLKGTFCATRHAAEYWRSKARQDGAPVKASVVCTSSGAGLLNNAGQTNYGSAKAGIAAFAQIAAKELGRYGVRVNTIAPIARTRLTVDKEGIDYMVKAPEDAAAFDIFDPANVSPLVAYLASERCPYTGGVWQVAGGQIGLLEGWRVVNEIDKSERWSIAELEKEIPQLVGDRGKGGDRLISEGQSLSDAVRILSARR